MWRMTDLLPPQQATPCNHPPCPQPARVAGWCWAHYLRTRRGKPMDPPVRPGTPRGLDPWTRALMRTRRNENGCLIFTGALNTDGYGQIKVAGTTYNTHVIAWEHHHGPVRQGKVLDHRCGVRACMEVTHLEPVTVRVNTLRGTGPTALNAAKTHCCQGHPLTGGNLMVRRGTGGHRWRNCRECDRARTKARRTGVAPPRPTGGTDVDVA